MKEEEIRWCICADGLGTFQRHILNLHQKNKSVKSNSLGWCPRCTLGYSCWFQEIHVYLTPTQWSSSWLLLLEGRHVHLTWTFGGRYSQSCWAQLTWDLLAQRPAALTNLFPKRPKLACAGSWATAPRWLVEKGWESTWPMFKWLKAFIHLSENKGRTMWFLEISFFKEAYLKEV